MAALRLGVPSKGRLQEKTINWFAIHGIDLHRTGSDREYSGAVSGVANVELVLLSAGEIPRELAAGRIHLGVTGTDLVREQIPLWSGKITEIQELGFGFADLILAVPRVWVDVDCLDDLDAVAAQFRVRHGHRLRIATKYHALTRAFLKENGVADYQLVDSQGATEGTVRNQTAEAVADITSTGETLRANHLKILSDGLILRSQATVFAGLEANWTDQARGALAGMAAKTGWALPKRLRRGVA
jgi:ATP phosphoribosyltransferase